MAPAHESLDSFGSRGTLRVGDRSLTIHRVDALDGAHRLPFSLMILLENLLRNEDGSRVTREQIEALAGWDLSSRVRQEILVMPARVFLHDTNGTPVLVDLAGMRDAMLRLGGDPAAVNPVVPAELVIDHSVNTDFFASPAAFERNVELEYERNGERIS